MVAQKGILICGPSGSGKTSLSLALIRRALVAGQKATLIADDQSSLSITGHGRIAASCPTPIAGLVEVRPYGVISHGLYIIKTIELDLMVELTADEIPRVQDGDQVTLLDCSIARIKLPLHPAGSAITACFVALGLPCWY